MCWGRNGPVYMTGYRLHDWESRFDFPARAGFPLLREEEIGSGTHLHPTRIKGSLCGCKKRLGREAHQSSTSSARLQNTSNPPPPRLHRVVNEHKVNFIMILYGWGNLGCHTTGRTHVKRGCWKKIGPEREREKKEERVLQYGGTS